MKKLKQEENLFMFMNQFKIEEKNIIPILIGIFLFMIIINISSRDMEWVNSQSSIISNGKLDIKATNETMLKGGVIGSETGQMVLDTGKLTTEDIKDKDYNESSGFSVGTTIGSSSNGKDKNKFPSGSTNLSMQNEGSEKEQTTKATIGAGTVIVGGQEKTDLGNVNRDLNNTQQITKDEITGALNANLTIDNRMFTEEGRESIANDIKNVGKNTKIATYGALNTISNAVETAYTVMTDKNVGLDEIVDVYKAKQSQQVTALTRGGNEKARDTLNNVSEGKDIKEIEGALQVGVEEGKGSKIYYENEKGKDKETIGFNDKTTGESYINGATEYQNEERKKVSAVTDTNELIKVDAHEQSHKYTENETIANIAGSEAKSAWAITNWIYGDSINTSGTATSTSWLSQQMNNTSSLGTLINNTVNAGKVAEENRLEKIKITGEDKFKQQTLDLLGKLTRDKLSLKEDGTVLITNLDNKSDKKNSGTELIRELNKKYETTKQEIDKNNVEIVYLENGKNTSEGAYDGNAGMTKGLGTSSFVQYNPDFDYTSLLNDSHLVKDNGITSAQTALSHELIHSYHDKLGTTEPRGSEKVPGYENQTVGLGNFKNNKITENTIRKEQGENERTKYS